MLRHLIEEFWKAEHLRRGYQFVYTPHLASEKLYEISGHLENYADLMYSPMDIDGRPYRVKPMNCPGHILVYNTRRHSYRELPIRFAELGTARCQQGRSDARDEVGPRAVVREPELPRQDSRGHGGTRRLAVRCRDDRRAERKPAGELVDGCRVELPEQLAGHGCAPARTGEPREAPRGARQEDLQPQRKAG